MKKTEKSKIVKHINQKVYIGAEKMASCLFLQISLIHETNSFVVT